MIIEFKVKNFRSIKEQQTFSLVASTATELEQNTFFADAESSLRLVRSAVIYGPNAGGKSNLLSALLFMRMFILTSAKDSQQGEKIPVEGFRFDPSVCSQPSEFEITFIKNQIRYQYGFSVNDTHVVEEWLFAYPSGRAQQWFSRAYVEKSNEYRWKFSKYFKGSKQVVGLTRNNVLFLSNAVKLNNEQLVPVFSWFQKDLILIDPPGGRGLSPNKTIDQIKNLIGKDKILKFMHAADPTIVDIIVDTEKFSDKSFPNNIPPAIREYYKKEFVDKDIHKVSVVHVGGIPLDLHNESEGTNRLFSFAGRWLDALENGQILIVDELDNSLHALVVRFLVGLINDPEINTKKAQLIFSTHDTSLLDTDIFRRDQVWFVEKDKSNATQLYPLLDFSPRKQEAIGRGYLQGRYGALPYIGEWRY